MGELEQIRKIVVNPTDMACSDAVNLNSRVGGSDSIEGSLPPSEKSNIITRLHHLQLCPGVELTLRQESNKLAIIVNDRSDGSCSLQVLLNEDEPSDMNRLSIGNYNLSISHDLTQVTLYAKVKGLHNWVLRLFGEANDAAACYVLPEGRLLPAQEGTKLIIKRVLEDDTRTEDRFIISMGQLRDIW